MRESVVSQAKSWGFTCQLTASGNWQIFSPQPKERWQLSELENRWMLKLGNVPQIYLTHPEALRFLERRFLDNRPSR